MKAPISVLLLVALAISVSGAAESTGFRAGAAAVDITPKEFPLNMPGGFSANPADRAHDPLFARTLVLDDGTTVLSMTVIDNLGAPPEILNEAKQAASAATGIPVQRMLISSTHTHTGPPANATSGPAPAVAYRNLLINGIAESIIQAHAARQAARAGAGVHAMPEEVFNRRWYLKPGQMPLNPFGKYDAVKMNPGTSPSVLDRPAGPTDPDITVLSVQTEKRQPMALFANYSLHYVGGSPQGQISADYFGEFARVVPSRFRAGANFVGVMSNGTSGDINNIPFGVTRPPREPFEQIRIVAQKAADAAWFACQDVTYRQDLRLEMRERDIPLTYRRPTSGQIAEAQAMLAIHEPAAVAKLPALAQNYARSVISAAERKEETLTVKIQAIRIGDDFAVCGIPFETFAETGLDLKKRSPFPRTMVIGLAN
jgi:hypothetical protein